MQRRTFLASAAASVGGLAVSPRAGTAADSELDCGVWYDAEITDAVDGDTFDVFVHETGTEYNVRTIGHDTPEKSGNTRFERIQEWEFVEDDAHLEAWGNEATAFAQDELPAGTECQIQLDCESEEIDEFGRLLARIRYDRDGDGTVDTVYNELTVREGYARVYAASTSDTDTYLDRQRDARAAGRGVWAAADGHVHEWRNREVTRSFHPHTSSIRTTDGAIDPSRVPVWAEPEAVQENTTASTVAYDDVPLVGVDEANNLAYFGGCTLNEEWERQSADLDHFTFVANLVEYLHDDADPSGPVLVDGGHRTFEQDNAVSAEDVAYFQRFLEGVDVELHSSNTYGDGNGYGLAEARALVASCSPQEWTDEEVAEVRNFVDGGGVVLLMGSGSETAAERATLDALAADLGSDLRLNADDVRDDANHVGGSRKLLGTARLNTADFDLWSPVDSARGVRPDVLDADPNGPGATATHTWTLSDPSEEFAGEADTITVEYPAGTSLDGLTDADVAVFVDRDGDGTVDEIGVNSDSYAGSTATFDLDGRFDTSVEGEVRVEVAGVVNAGKGDHVATETLAGDDTHSVEVEYNVTDLAVTTDEPTRVSETAATLNGTLDHLDGANWGDVSFEWGPAGDTSNVTVEQRLDDPGSFGVDLSGLATNTEYEYRAVVTSNREYTSVGGVRTFTTGGGARSDVLDADPNTAGDASVHTWTLSDPSDEFAGELDTITVEYPSGTSLDGLTDADVTVFVDRDGDGTVDEIGVNSDSYAGSAATIDLDGRFDTSVEGEVRVEIDGVVNPDAGDYVAAETLDGDDTHSVDAEFLVE